MNALQFTQMTEPADENAVVSMMQALYTEDATSAVDVSRFPQTVHTLISEPTRGQIVLICADLQIAGYALLIPYWSNEFGGTIVYVDELFVKPEHRNRGIGRAFFEHIRATRPFDAVAFLLEVSPTNTNATRLYESIGFTRRKLSTYVRFNS